MGAPATEISQDTAFAALPLIVFIGVMCVVGTVGNVVVIVVYNRKYPMCNFKYFVIILAVIDLISCCSLMPFEIYTLMHWYTFKSAAMCKTKSFFNAFTVTSSASTLLLIAIDRFRKVCRPHSKQIQPEMALKLAAVVLGLSLIPAASDGVFWGTHSFDILYEGKNVTAYMCEKDDAYKDTILPQLHVLILYGCTNLIVMISTMILYIFIANKMFCQQSVPGAVPVPRVSITLLTPLSMNSGSAETPANAKSNVFQFTDLGVESGLSDTDDAIDSVVMSDVSVKRPSSSCQGSQKTDEGVENNDKDDTETAQSPVVMRRKSLSDIELKEKRANEQHVRMSLDILSDKECSAPFLQVPTFNPRGRPSLRLRIPPTTDAHGGRPSTPSTASPSNAFQRRRRRRSTIVGNLSGRRGAKLRRKTLIMFILTTVFVITTIMYLSLIAIMSDSAHFITTLSGTEWCLWMFFLRLYFVNSVLNPILYGFLDPRFRSALYGMGVRVGFLVGSVKRNVAMSFRGGSARGTSAEHASNH